MSATSIHNRQSDSDPSSLAVLVMSKNGERREEWAAYLEGLGLRPIRCAGPEATNCALVLGKGCVLHEEADLIFYDQDSVTPALEAELSSGPPGAPIAYARGQRGPGGREIPVPIRISFGSRLVR